MNKDVKIFLLGGYDLEMLEIKRLLKQTGCRYFDRGLSWATASLDAYVAELEKYGNHPGIIIYGVELSGGSLSGRYNNYSLIDHHNEFQERKSSLEQISDILGLKLTRYQILVAANDRGYIPAMQASGATWDEIQTIRRQDRAAQGITEEEEILAQKAIDEYKEEYGDLIIVRAESPHFSPICDRLWPYRKLLVFTDDLLCYYGKGKHDLTAVFEQDLKLCKMYHGGGDDGFIGCVAGYYSPERICELIVDIKKVVANL